MRLVYKWASSQLLLEGNADCLRLFPNLKDIVILPFVSSLSAARLRLTICHCHFLFVFIILYCYFFVSVTLYLKIVFKLALSVRLALFKYISRCSFPIRLYPCSIQYPSIISNDAGSSSNAPLCNI